MQRAEVQQFIDDFTAQHKFDRQRVERWFSQARYSPAVERYMQPPIAFGQRNWIEYRARYLDEPRVVSGAAFVRNHQAAMERAQREFGVPPEIIAAIIGVETHYGRITGNFRTLDALVTLSFDYLRRADYFRQQLTEFFLLVREQNVDPLSIKGSFAGRAGLPQFMPVLFRPPCVAFDGDGRVDRRAALPMRSVGGKSSSPRTAGSATRRSCSTPSPMRPSSMRSGAAQLCHCEVVDALEPASKVTCRFRSMRSAVIGPANRRGGDVERLYRVGTVNFSALLHYNRSYFYASAVVDLSRAIAQAANR